MKTRCYSSTQNEKTMEKNIIIVQRGGQLVGVERVMPGDTVHAIGRVHAQAGLDHICLWSDNGPAYDVVADASFTAGVLGDDDDSDEFDFGDRSTTGGMLRSFLIMGYDIPMRKARA